MAHATLAPVLRHVRRLVAAPDVGELSDGQLLARFVAGREEAAFAALLRRHGPMVLGVCRRLLDREHDAEDAFQATFFILARRAASVRRGEALAGWLYEVAYHTAGRARAAAVRRRFHEQRVLPMCPNVSDAPLWRDLRPVLDEELARLPEKYRLPVVACYLEGDTLEQTARRLGWRRGTVAGRLARARELLRHRLERRGVTLSAGLLAALLAENAAGAAVPAGLFTTTLGTALPFAAGKLAAGAAPSAVVLAEGVLKTMTGIKLHLAAALVLAVGLFGSGAGALLSQTKPAEPQEKQAASEGTAATTKPDGDALPAGALARLGSGRLRHGHHVMSVVFSPDGKSLASSGHDHAVRLWDVAGGKLLRSFWQDRERLDPFAPSRWQYAVAFSPDGQLMATGEHANGWQIGTIRLWEAATGKELHALKGHQLGVHSLAFSPDGKTLASGSEDATVRLWDVATGKEEQQFEALHGRLRYVAFAGGKVLVTATDSKSVRVWEAGADGRFVAKGSAIEGVEAAACSSDGKLLALGGDKGVVRLWDVAANKETRKLEGHEGPLARVAFSGDGKTLASGGRDRTLRVWDVATGNERAVVRELPSQVRALALSADGALLASAGESDIAVHLWDAATGKALERAGGHRGVVTQLRYAADGKTLLSTSWDHTYRHWTVAGKELGAFRDQYGSSNSAALSPDGKTVACGGADGVIHLLEAGTGRELQALQKHDQAVLRVAFSADGKTLASAGADRTLRIWDVAAGKELRRFDGPYDQANRLVLAPDGKMAAWTTDSQTIRLCDLATGAELRTLTPQGAVVSVAFSPDGKLLATGGQDGKVYLYDTATGDKQRELPGNPGWVAALVFSADGRSLAVGSWMTANVWEVATGKERIRFTGQGGDTFSVALAPDGRTLASGGGDSTILLWDLTGQGGKVARKALTPPEVETVWADFTGDDAAKGYRALWTLTAAPEQALPLLRNALAPPAAVDAKRVAKLIADLDADDFDVRDKASQELEKIGEPAEAALRKALEEQTSAEVRRRAQELLEKLKGSAASTRRLATLRSLEAVEQLGTAEARHLLEGLAKGTADAWLTKEAKQAVERLGKRP